MSRTDKTDPPWLQEFLYGEVTHDHRGGACVEETLETARPTRDRYHYLRCPKNERVVVACPEDATCGRWWRMQFSLSTVRQRRAFLVVEPHTHTRLVSHPDVPCAYCDTRPPTPTCERRVSMKYVEKVRLLYGDGPDQADYNRYEAAARRAARDVLRDAARDYNANGDTDVELEPVRHRHVAQWDAW